MISLPGYRILDRIYESNSSLVFRAIRGTDGMPVVLKYLRGDHPPPERIVRYKQEYRITSMLSEVPGVIGVHGLEKAGNSFVMILEDFGAESLDILIRKEAFELPELLAIFSRLTEIIGRVHAAHVVHKDINPSNVVYNRSTRELKVIDFGIASILSREDPVIKRPELLEGTLAYISPEQTGRMNRAVDYRTDYYSLGATFYELLTGRLPFETSDPLELVHCHMAKVPVAPHVICPDVPTGLSEIVVKLLSKDSEDRYQSSIGIREDLKECVNRLEATDTVGFFSLGQRDVPERFAIPQKLYGREGDSVTLAAAFDRAERGGREVVMLSGPAGIGKTALVREVAKRMVEHRGFFISGKFDLLQHSAPYFGLAAAFRGLVKQILSEPEDRLQYWRHRCLSALGSNAQLISDVIPELELIIGKQPRPEEVEHEEARNRFNLVFGRFLSVFCAKEHPLILFLDDLQWADSSSLAAFQSILTKREIPYLLVIGAYRDGEVGPDDPLNHTLAALVECRILEQTIQLKSLERDDLARLCHDALHRDTTSVLPLADLLLNKTGGNPFHVAEFLKMLYVKHLLDFDVDAGGWGWDFEKIAALGIADNVVDLVADKIDLLSLRTHHVLKFAACLGNRFDLRVLALVVGKTEKDTLDDLREAIAEGLVAPVGDEWRFVELGVPLGTTDSRVDFVFRHDRVQQAAYCTIPPSERPAVHLRAGELLLDRTPENQIEENVFNIVGQLNLARDLLTQAYEREILARLNLQAGKKAVASAAYESAFSYFSVAVDLLDQDRWTSAYDFAWELHLETARAAYLCSDFDRMARYCQIALAKARTPVERAQISEVLIQAAIAQYQMPEAVKIGLSVLDDLGVHIPERPRTVNVILDFIKTSVLVLGKGMTRLRALPEMTRPEMLAAMRIMSVVLKAAYAVSLELTALLAFKSVRLSIGYGNAPESAVAYAIYGALLCDRVGAIATGYRFGEFALQLSATSRAARLKSRTAMVTNFLVRHWKEHYRNSLELLLEAYRFGLESGSVDDAAYCAYAYCTGLFRVGHELGAVEQHMESYCDILRTLKHESALRLLEIFHRTVTKLTKPSDDPCSLEGSEYLDRNVPNVCQRAQHRSALCCVHLNQLMLCYLFEDYAGALRNSGLALECLDGVAGTPAAPVYYLYDSLTRLALYETTPLGSRRPLFQRAKSNLRKLKRWAQYAPMNQEHRQLLVEAERLKVMLLDAEAAECYDKAIAMAHENDYLNEAALANELAAKFHVSRSRMTIAKGYMLEALYCYRRWGAEAKVKHLIAKYPHLTAAATEAPTTVLESVARLSSGSGDTGQALDLAWVMKSAQAIAGEIVLDRLLDALMRIVIENAGADRGWLILANEEELVVSAEVHADKNGETVLESMNLEDCTEIPANIVNYVARTHENLVINDSSRESVFAPGQHLMKDQPKSVLCAPLIHQGKLTGILYLENRLTTDAFTADRLELVRFLCSQAAISVENARYHDQLAQYSRTLEERVADRTAELVAINVQLNAEISLRKQTEEALRASEERLELAVDSADLGLWDLNPQTDEGFVNERGAKLFGYSLEELVQHYEMWRTLFHPDDVPVAERLFDLHLQGQTPLFECEMRVRMKGGDWRWALVRGRIVERDDEGKPLRVAGTFMDITDRREADDRIRTSLREKEVLVREIHHRVKNNLQVMTSLLRLQARYAKDEAGPDIFRECEDRLRSMAMVHERLYQSENLAFLKVDDYLTSLIGHLQGSYGAAAGRISLRTAIQPVALNIDTAIPIGFIVTELVTNCLKHAFPDGRHGVIEITLRDADAGVLELVVRDNGIGMSLDRFSDTPQSLGLQLVKIFSSQLAAQVHVDGSSGCEFRITFREVKRRPTPVQSSINNGGRTHERIGHSQREEDSCGGR